MENIENKFLFANMLRFANGMFCLGEKNPISNVALLMRITDAKQKVMDANFKHGWSSHDEWVMMYFFRDGEFNICMIRMRVN